jgi:hypothetical protein
VAAPIAAQLLQSHDMPTLESSPAPSASAPALPVISTSSGLLAPDTVGRKVGPGTGLRGWFRSLPPETRVEFAPNPKGGESAKRYECYSAATTLESIAL